MNVRITVMKTEFYSELAEVFLTDGKDVGPCPILNVGDIFLYQSTEEAVMPEGFCPWAWVGLYPAVSRRAIECAPRKPDSEYWYKHPGKSIECCTDGIRPVVFLLEQVAED